MSAIEKSILSMAFQYPETSLVRLIGDGVTSQHFYEPRHRLIFDLMKEQRDKGKEIELVSFTKILIDRSQLDSIGGAAYITEIYTYSIGEQHYTYHLEILRNDLAKRLAREALQLPDEEIQQMTPSELANHLKLASESVTSASEWSDGTKTAKEACREFFDTLEHQFTNKNQVGTKTGLQCLDNVTNGMREGELWVIAAPTSGGKSVLALQLALSSLEQNKRVAIFSLEMGAEENIARMISNSHSVDYSALRKPSTLDKAMISKIKQGAVMLSGKNLVVCDKAELSIESIQATAQRLNDVDPIDTLVVDYIQLLRSSYRKGERSDEMLCRVSGQLKQMAKKLQCCVITASQLNQEGRMAQASGIANDADVVLRIEDEKGIFVLKNRNGEKHMHLPLFLQGEYQRFIENHTHFHHNEKPAITVAKALMKPLTDLK